jgi:DNA-binding CsgD family transcriptional regulator
MTKRDPIAAAHAFADLFPKDSPDQRTIFKAEHDKEVILQHLRFAGQIYPDCAITMCPVSHPSMSYFSSNAGAVFGRPQQQLESLPLAGFMSLAHSEDLPAIRQCFAYIKQLEPFDPTQYRFTLYYRICSADGKYFAMRNENIAIQTENAYLYLMLFSRVPAETRFHQVKLEVSKQIKGQFKKIRTYTPRHADQPMTPRQQDIARLIAQGYANHEIAEQLNVSIYTVKNHKQTLFRKVNVKNSMELAHYFRNEATP